VQTCGFLKISAGNLLETKDFGKIWENSEFLNAVRQKNFSGKCGNCNYVNICGGCRARAFAQTADFLASDPLCPYVNSISTLIAAHIEEDKLNAVAQAVNALPDVSHNYLRNHYYNLWFTLKAKNSDQINKMTEELSKKFKTDFLSFPSTSRFKLDSSAIKHHNPPHTFNALFCCRADDAAVRFLCCLPQVSHCIGRKPLPHWPYNIYIMLHEKSPQQLEKTLADFVKRFAIDQYQIMPTIKSLR
jgi:radical SAM protein with 4Fe4S-binding SPASM domain